MNTRIWAMLGVGLALLVGACVAQQQSASAEPSLSGNWRVTSLVGAALPAGAEVTIGFVAPSVSGKSGCNSYSANYTQSAKNLTFGPIAMTRMACPPALMDLEAGFSTALSAVTRYDMAGETLQLFVGDSLMIQAQRQ